MTNTVEATKITKTAIVKAIFEAGLPYREEIGNRGFRKIVFDVAKAATNSSPSIPMLYNKAKEDAIEAGLTADFGRGIDAKVGPKPDLTTDIALEMYATVSQAARIVAGVSTIPVAINTTLTTTQTPAQKEPAQADEAPKQTSEKKTYTWNVVNKKTGEVVGTAPSRRKAQAIKNGNKELTVKQAN